MSTKLGVVLTIILSLSFIFIFIVYYINKNEDHTDIVLAVIDLGDTITSLKGGNDVRDDFIKTYNYFISEDIDKQLEEYLQKLKENEDSVLNITEYYNTKYNTLGSNHLDQYASGASADDHLYEYFEEEVEVTEVTDERVYEENGDYYIKVNDLNISNGKEDLVLFEGKYITVTSKDVPETYTHMVSNPENKYKYIRHNIVQERNKIKYIEVSYVSILNSDKRMLVRANITDNKITSFEVRE